MRSPLHGFLRRSRWRLFGLLVFGLCLVGLGLLVWIGRSVPHRHELTITGGVRGLNRDQIASSLKRHGGETGLTLEVLGSEGTAEATAGVQDGRFDLALVNGLLRSPAADRVRQVAGVATEALHLLVKREHVERVAADLGLLAGLSVSFGPAGSETEALSRAVLAFCGIGEPGSGGQRIDRRGIRELSAALDEIATGGEGAGALRAAMPDAVFHVSTLPSPLARRLIQDGDYGLVPLPFADAFSRVTVDEEEWDRDHIDQVHAVAAGIPAYMYGASPPIPARDLDTLGCPLVLVARRDVPDDAILRLLPQLFEGPIRTVYDPPQLDAVAPTFPWHQASLEYRDRDKPLLRADLVAAIQQVFGVIAPLTGGLIALYGFYRWRQVLRFVEYFEHFQQLDLRAKGLTRDDVVTPAEALEARRLEAELTRLQQRAVTDFCRNYFHGEGVLENFLSLLAETRDFLRASRRESAGRVGDLDPASGTASLPGSDPAAP